MRRRIMDVDRLIHIVNSESFYYQNRFGKRRFQALTAVLSALKIALLRGIL
jgi:hypothetical protein